MPTKLTKPTKIVGCVSVHPPFHSLDQLSPEEREGIEEADHFSMPVQIFVDEVVCLRHFLQELESNEMSVKTYLRMSHRALDVLDKYLLIDSQKMLNEGEEDG